MKEPLIFYHSAVFAKSRLRRANLLTSIVDLPAADHRISSLRPNALLATLIRLRDENHTNLSTFLHKTTPASDCISLNQSSPSLAFYSSSSRFEKTEELKKSKMEIPRPSQIFFMVDMVVLLFLPETMLLRVL